MYSKENRTKLYVFEGLDGSGKSTLAKELRGHFMKRHAQASLYAFPGNISGALGKLIYDIHHNPTGFGLDSLNPTSLQILHVAAHIDILDKSIIPALTSGEIVILDRYWWSVWVYGIVNGADRRSLKKAIEAELYHWKNIKPAALFWLRRRSNLNQASDRDFQSKLDTEYEKLADRERKKYNVIVVNNDGSVSESLNQILSEIGTDGKGNIIL